MSSDPSHSRIYLTTSNNPYGSIHGITEDPDVRAERQKRNDRLINHKSNAVKRKITPLLKSTPKRSQIFHPVTVAAQSLITPLSAMASMNDIDREIYAPPESSDEENLPDTSLDTANHEKSRGAKRKAPSPKRPLNTRDMNAGRSKRRKISDEQPLPSTMPEKGSDRLDDNDMFFSQRVLSQELKPRKRYIKSSSQATSFSPTSSAAQSKSATTTLRPVPENPPPKEDKSKKSNPKFKNVSSSPTPPPSTKPHRSIKDVELSPEMPKKSSRPIFQDVEASDSDTQQTSNTTSGTSKSTVFDNLGVKQRNRRDSSSSLSSIDSLIEYQLDPAQKAALSFTMDDPLPSQSDSLTTTTLQSNQVLCPTCRRPTSLLNLPGHSPSTDPATLPLRQQTKFCYDHRIRDAQETWSEKGYPTISWDTLPSSANLKTQLTRLTALLRRKIPSHYLSVLDSAIASAKGNQSAINRAFDVTNIHHGYYGPRGAKVITQAIMDDEGLQKQLSRSLRSDKSMRTAGLGRLTDCVLVPEVLVGLVQEDLVLGAREEAGIQARQVLEESGELGLLLCGGDDEVEVGMGGEDEEESGLL